jgi:signal transduction histidine kinase
MQARGAGHRDQEESFSMSTFVNRAMRAPWGFPLVLIVALTGAGVNEHVHRLTMEGLAQSRQAEQAVRSVNEANYFALDRVNSLRAYLLQPSPVWVTRYEEANTKLSQSVGTVVAFLEDSGGSGRVAAERLQTMFAERSADLARGFDLALAQRPADALEALRESDTAGRGVGLRSSLLQAIERAQAGRAKVDARVQAATEALRWFVHALIAAMVLAAYALLRQTQQIDAARRQQAELLEREVSARTAELRELAGHLITTREDERARLARELHDEMGGLLSTIKLDLARLRHQREMPDGALARVEAVGLRVSEVVEIKRQVIENLRPSALDHLGVTQAVALLCRENAAAMEVPTHEDLEPLELLAELELTIYRVVQEALTNVRKYSRASEVWVTLKSELDRVHVVIEDDGVGFARAHEGLGHHGLVGMRLRVESQDGQLQLGSGRQGRGARVQAVLPLRRRVQLDAA